MKVQVLFFGATAQVVGEREIEMEFPEPASAKDVFGKIIGEFPALVEHKLLFAVNQEYAAGDEPVKDGDELAVFTAVSGG